MQISVLSLPQLLLFFSFSFPLFLQNIYAQTPGETNLYLQNNTHTAFTVSSSQSGTHVMDPSEWSGMNGSFGAWQPETLVLSSNRDAGIHDGDDFFFDVKLMAGGDTLSLQLYLQGSFFGSAMWHSLKGPGFNHTWANDHSFYQETFAFNGKTFTAKYEAYFTGTYDDVLFAIQEHDPYTVAPADSNTFTVFAYNVYMLTPPIAITDQGTRADYIPDHVHDYDALIISEAFDNTSRTATLLPQLAVEYPYQTAVVDTAGAFEDGGVLIVSRWPILKSARVVFDDCDGDDCLAAKGVMYAKINKSGKPYHLFGTHTQAWETPDGSAARVAQFRQMRDFIDAQGIPAGEPVIIGGDLNVDRYNNYLGEYDSLLFVMNAAVPIYTGYPYTWDAAVNYYADGAPPEYLDYAMYLQDFLVPVTATNEPRILRSIEDDMWDIFDLSDHFGVYGRFEFPTMITSMFSAEVSEISSTKVFPNPSAGASTISFEIRQAGEAKLFISDLTGRLIRVINPGYRDAGLVTLVWDGNDEAGRMLRAGVYLIRIEMGNSRRNLRVMRID